MRNSPHIQENLINVVNFHTSVSLLLDAIEETYTGNMAVSPKQLAADLAYLQSALTEIDARKTILKQVGFDDEFDDISSKILELIKLVKTYHKED